MADITINGVKMEPIVSASGLRQLIKRVNEVDVKIQDINTKQDTKDAEHDAGIASNKAAIAKEATDRKTQDGALSNAILGNGDMKVDFTGANYIAGSKNLQSAIITTDAQIKANADAITDIKGDPIIDTYKNLALIGKVLQTLTGTTVKNADGTLDWSDINPHYIHAGASLKGALQDLDTRLYTILETEGAADVMDTLKDFTNWATTHENDYNALKAAVDAIKFTGVTDNAARNYAVTKANDGNLYVNVPWTDTVYTLPTATDKVLGGVKIGANINLADDGTISVAAPVTSLPYANITGTPALKSVATTASYNDLIDTPAIPVAPVQSDWSQTDDTKLDYIKNKPAAYTLPTATDKVLGGVKIGANVTITDGAISVATPFSGSYNDLKDLPTFKTINGTTVTGTGDIKIEYVLPQATDKVLGGVKIGANINLADDGTISVAAPFSGSYNDLNDKPTIPAAQIQSDWNQTDNTKLDYIKNKPAAYTLPTATDKVLGGVKSIVKDPVTSADGTYVTYYAQVNADGTISINIPIASINA